jgi:hypothetical protein
MWEAVRGGDKTALDHEKEQFYVGRRAVPTVSKKRRATTARNYGRTI